MIAKSRIILNIGHGTVWKYTWRTIRVLVKLIDDYVWWPDANTRQSSYSIHSVFQHYIGFLNGSSIILREMSLEDPQAYLSKKKNYSFSLQAVCNQHGSFIWISIGQTASVHDLGVFRKTDLYYNSSKYFDSEIYLLADTAYRLECHLIVPYKEPAASRPENTYFNIQVSKLKVKIKHVFRVLEARWPTQKNLPVYTFFLILEQYLFSLIRH